MRNILVSLFGCLLLLVGSCKKDNPSPPVPIPNASFYYTQIQIGSVKTFPYVNIPVHPTFKIKFSTAINRSSVAGQIRVWDPNFKELAYNITYEQGDSAVAILCTDPFAPFTKNFISISANLLSVQGEKIKQTVSLPFITELDTNNKFPIISDDALLDKVQAATLKYFWDFGHPNCGLARERNTSGDLVTIGGSGFGVMAIIAGADRGFISKTAAAERILTMSNFLYYKAQRFHGAFPHWMNGITGNVIPMSLKDNGADLVETSYMMQGLLCARQYFNGNNSTEDSLRATINKIWDEIEWTWFRKNNENVLYWHWSANYGWDMNMQIKGWNECLITYIMAASSRTFNIPKIVYTAGYTSNGGIKNNNTYYGYKLPLGWSMGGPLFFAHYTFLGVNPHSLTDDIANYWDQNVAHSKINYSYCVANPRNHFGYGPNCWGLTASDNDVNGYSAHEPNNDLGIISPTAALSSMPYTPTESMNALRFFYYKLGDKMFKQYGFVDAIHLSNLWFADSFLAIDQGPIMVMLENHRSGLLWNLFMSCPEVKTGMKSIGFQSPFLQ